MSCNYVATAQRATAVTGALKCNFTDAGQLNLIVVKNTRLEISTVTPDGLKLVKEVGVYGRVSVLKAFRPVGESKDVLFLLTAKYNAAILDWSQKDGQILTRACGSVAENTGRPSETGMIAIIDPHCKVIGLRLVDGLFKIIQWQTDSRELKLTSLRMEQMNVLDIAFLHGYNQPTIAFIHQSSNNGRHIQTSEICLQEKELLKGPWKQENIESEASFIIAVPSPIGGVIVVGDESITYHLAEGRYVAVAPSIIRQSTMVVWEQVDPEGQRYLVGDMAGRLFLLVLETGEEQDGMIVKDLKIELLGETSIAEALVYLDNGVVFVGSRLGDSQLIRLSSEPNDSGSFIFILETFTNLGPILDMLVVDLEKQGQNQLVTCSNAFKTRTLLLQNEEVEECDLAGFQYNQQTFYAANFTADFVLQVTETDVRLIRSSGGGLTDCWTVPLTVSVNSDEKEKAAGDSCRRVSVVVCNAAGGQILLASGRDLFYLTVENGKIVEKNRETLKFEVACLDMSLTGETGLAEICAVGLWTNISVRLLHLPSMQIICDEQLGLLYLLVALGDGTLLYYRMHPTTGALMDKKKMTLGTQPAVLKTFQSRGATNVFGCSDRPTIVYSSNQKLVFSNVNLRMVTQMCSLSTPIYSECLAMTDGQTLIFGSVDEIQKLHIRTVPFGETARRIAHQHATKTFAVLTIRHEMQDADGVRYQGRQSASLLAQTTSHSGQISSNRPSTAAAPTPSTSASPSSECEELEVHNILILDQNTFEIIHAHQLGPNEQACSLVSCKLGDDPATYYVVGTAFVYPEESEAKQGRLLVFEYSCAEQSGPQFQLIHEKEIKGAPYCLKEFNGKLLAAINSSVRLFEWSSSPGEKELRLECSHFSFIVALYLKCKGDFVLVGDLMRSVSLLLYKPLEASFEEIARDYQPNWMTGVEMIDDDTFLGAENSFNLFTCQKDSAATTDEDRQHLQEVGRFHIGEMINCFSHGSLVMHQQAVGEPEAPISTPILFGTVLGAIGMVAQLPEQFFSFLHQLELKLAKSIHSIGKIDHSSWRSFHTERRQEAATGFVDGDLIETFLDLSRAQMSEIVHGLQVDDGSGMKREATVDDVVKIVEELSRLN